MQTFSDRIDVIIQSQGNVHRLSKLLGVAPTTIMRWKTGESDITRQNLIKLAEATGYNILWLATGEGAQMSAQNELKVLTNQTDDFVDVKTTCITDDGQILTKTYHFRKDWIKKITSNSQNLAIYNVKDDSMSPNLSKGDMALIETYTHKTSDRIMQGLDTLNGLDDGLYVMRVNGRLTLRRIQFNLMGQILVKPDNKLFDSFTFNLNELDSSNIIGKVLWHCHEV